MDIGLKLRELRKAKKLTQKRVAKLTGISEQMVSALETGRRTPCLKIWQLQKLLQAYGVTEYEFFSPEMDEALAEGASVETCLQKKKFEQGRRDALAFHRPRDPWSPYYVAGYAKGETERAKLAATG